MLGPVQSMRNAPEIILTAQNFYKFDKQFRLKFGFTINPTNP